MLPFFAYIDPFTGALLYQLLVMAFMSVLIFYKKVRTFVIRLFVGITKEVKSELESADVLPIKSDESSEEVKKAA
jgi:hypothetical protein